MTDFAAEGTLRGEARFHLNETLEFFGVRVYCLLEKPGQDEGAICFDLSGEIRELTHKMSLYNDPSERLVIKSLFLEKRKQLFVSFALRALEQLCKTCEAFRKSYNCRAVDLKDSNTAPAEPSTVRDRNEKTFVLRLFLFGEGSPCPEQSLPKELLIPMLWDFLVRSVSNNASWVVSWARELKKPFFSIKVSSRSKTTAERSTVTCVTSKVASGCTAPRETPQYSVCDPEKDNNCADCPDAPGLREGTHESNPKEQVAAAPVERSFSFDNEKGLAGQTNCACLNERVETGFCVKTQNVSEQDGGTSVNCQSKENKHRTADASSLAEVVGCLVTHLRNALVENQNPAGEADNQCSRSVVNSVSCYTELQKTLGPGERSAKTRASVLARCFLWAYNHVLEQHFLERCRETSDLCAAPVGPFLDQSVAAEAAVLSEDLEFVLTPGSFSQQTNEKGHVPHEAKTMLSLILKKSVFALDHYFRRHSEVFRGSVGSCPRSPSDFERLVCKTYYRAREDTIKTIKDAIRLAFAE